MDTKELIIQTSLKLFNNYGFEDTSGRLIAKELKVSQGNLRYHFPQKEQIAEVLFQRFYGNFNTIFYRLLLSGKAVRLIDLFEVYHLIFNLYIDYRFIQRDLMSIINKIPSIGTTLRKDFNKRRELILNVFENLKINGYLIKRHDDFLYKKIIYLQIFIGDLWISHSQIYFGENLVKEKRHYHSHWLTLLLPFLTKKGLNELKEYIKKNSSLVPADFKNFVLRYGGKSV